MLTDGVKPLPTIFGVIFLKNHLEGQFAKKWPSNRVDIFFILNGLKKNVISSSA